MKWTQKLLASVAGLILLFPNVASAYYWYPTYSNYRPTTQATSPMQTAAPQNAPVSSTISAVEQSLLRLTNQERAKYGLAPLQADTTLASVARLKSSDMVAKNYFSHTSPTYGSPAQMLAKYGITYTYYAENLAQGADAASIHAMWMNSPGHRANILNARLNRVGIGVTAGRSGYTATQLFIAR